MTGKTTELQAVLEPFLQPGSVVVPLKAESLRNPVMQLVHKVMCMSSRFIDPLHDVRAGIEEYYVIKKENAILVTVVNNVVTAAAEIPNFQPAAESFDMGKTRYVCLEPLDLGS